MSTRNLPESKSITGSLDFYSQLVVKRSPIQGKGLFTEIGLNKELMIFKIKGEKMHHPYDPFMSDQNPNWIGVGYENWIVLAPGDIAIYLNHSCSPNVIINDKLELITIAAVKANEELLLDYSTTELDPYWKMNCTCGSSQCRKVLRSFQFLPDDLQNTYRNFLSPSLTGIEELPALHQRAS